MFEKYFGRKQNPEVRLNSSESFQDTGKEWWKESIKDPNFIEWFEGSVVVDESGEALPVFHATRNPNFDFATLYNNGSVRELGVHFGTSNAANHRLDATFYPEDISMRTPEKQYKLDYEYLVKHGELLYSPEELDDKFTEIKYKYETFKEEYEQQKAACVSGGEIIYPVFLKITNPVRLKDPGSFTDDNLKSIKRDLIKNFVTRDQVEAIKSVNSINELKERLISFGYDGIVYKNDREGFTGKGKENMDSFIPIVGSHQIRSVFEISKN